MTIFRRDSFVGHRRRKDARRQCVPGVVPWAKPAPFHALQEAAFAGPSGSAEAPTGAQGTTTTTTAAVAAIAFGRQVGRPRPSCALWGHPSTRHDSGTGESSMGQVRPLWCRFV